MSGDGMVVGVDFRVMAEVDGEMTAVLRGMAGGEEGVAYLIATACKADPRFAAAVQRAVHDALAAYLVRRMMPA